MIIRLLFKKTTQQERLQRKNYRPIALLNVDYKILSKVLTKRLNKCIDRVTTKSQTALKGSRIGDAILLIQSIIFEYSRHNTTDNAMLLFIDFEKAFDSIDHQFIFTILEALNFPPHFINLVKLGFTDTSCQLIINGFLTEAIPMPGGGRQGDCLFPLIFAIVVMTVDVLMDSDPQFEGLPLPLSDQSNIKVKQYADDTTPFISSPRDYAQCRKHLDSFCNASGSIINWDKSAALLLGNWILNPPTPHSFPQLFIDGIKIIDKDEPFRVLGIQLGIFSSPYLSINMAISKINGYLESRPQRQLNITGGILISNASIIGRAVFPIMHGPYTSSHARSINSSVNRLTNNDKSRGFFSLEEKCRTRANGGPTIPLIDSRYFFPTLHAALINQIINDNTPQHWHYFWINELYHFLERHHLSNINQLFISNLIPQNINRRSTIQPLVLQAFKSWKQMDFTYNIPKLLSYDELAVQPIWHNPNLTFQGTPFTPLKGFSSNELLTISCLCDNFNNGQDHTVERGHMFSGLELATKYPAAATVTIRETKTLFQRILLAVHPSWKKILEKGNRQFEVGEWVSTGILDDQLPLDQWDIYKVINVNNQQHLLYHTISPDTNILIPHVQSCAPWGQSVPQSHHDNGIVYDDHYPLRSEVRRVHVIEHSYKGVSKHLIIGYYTYTKPSPNHCSCFGILKQRYSTPYDNDFKKASKAYRHSKATVNPDLSLWPSHNNTDWNQTIKTIHFSRTHSKVRNMMWRILINKLYAASVAASYLTNLHSWSPSNSISQQEAIDSHAHCHLCSENNHSTAHALFECQYTGMIEYWRKVRDLFESINLQDQFPSTWDQWLTNINVDNNKSVRSIFIQDMQWNALYGVWINYNLLIAQAQKRVAQVGWVQDRFQEVVDDWGVNCYSTYCYLLSKRVLLLPGHIQAIEFDHAYDFGIDKVKRGEKVNSQQLAPPINFLNDDLDQPTQDHYNSTWCTNGIMARIEDKKVHIIIHGRPPDL